jgi:hypothetical protein
MVMKLICYTMVNVQRFVQLSMLLSFQGTEDRSQQNNRVQALRRLRQLIAIEGAHFVWHGLIFYCCIQTLKLVTYIYYQMVHIKLPPLAEGCVSWFFFAFESIKLFWMFMAFVWGVVRRPVELEGYSPPPELMRILPSSAKSGKKREGGQQIGPNHDDYVLVRMHWLHWASKDCLLYPFRRKNNVPPLL